MTLSASAREIYSKITEKGTKLGDLRIYAKQIKKDHKLAKELWDTRNLFARLLSVLIMDNKVLDRDTVQHLFDDIQNHEFNERIQLADWLLANQLTKSKSTIAMIESWENHPSSIQRRLFWYYQGRLRWVGQAPPDNSKELLLKVEEKMLSEKPEVQWAMNFTTAWIGIFDRANRSRCKELGERLGLYKDEVVAKGCSPNYLPMFIDLEVEKRNLT